MRTMLVILAILICSTARADATAGIETVGLRAGAAGESFDKCLAKFTKQHQSDNELNISLKPTDPSLAFMADCTKSLILVSKDPLQNRDLAGRLVAAWAKTEVADASGRTIRRIEITDSSPNSVSIPVVRIKPDALGALFGNPDGNYRVRGK